VWGRPKTSPFLSEEKSLQKGLKKMKSLQIPTKKTKEIDGKRKNPRLGGGLDSEEKR
jgi:hypothetical protein